MYVVQYMNNIYASGLRSRLFITEGVKKHYVLRTGRGPPTRFTDLAEKVWFL